MLEISTIVHLYMYINVHVCVYAYVYIFTSIYTMDPPPRFRLFMACSKGLLERKLEFQCQLVDSRRTVREQVLLQREEQARPFSLKAKLVHH